MASRVGNFLRSVGGGIQSIGRGVSPMTTSSVKLTDVQKRSLGLNDNVPVAPKTIQSRNAPTPITGSSATDSGLYVNIDDITTSGGDGTPQRIDINQNAPIYVRGGGGSGQVFVQTTTGTGLQEQMRQAPTPQYTLPAPTQERGGRVGRVLGGVVESLSKIGRQDFQKATGRVSQTAMDYLPRRTQVITTTELPSVQQPNVYPTPPIEQWQQQAMGRIEAKTQSMADVLAEQFKYKLEDPKLNAYDRLKLKQEFFKQLKGYQKELVAKEESALQQELNTQYGYAEPYVSPTPDVYGGEGTVSSGPVIQNIQLSPEALKEIQGLAGQGTTSAYGTSIPQTGTYTGTQLDYRGLENIRITPWSAPEKPKPSKTKLGDVFTAIYPYDVPAGAMTSQERQEIMKTNPTDIAFFGYAPYVKGFKLLKAQRDAEDKLRYEQARDIQNINIATSMAATRPGVWYATTTYETTPTKSFANILEPLAIPKALIGKNPFMKDVTVATTQLTDVDMDKLEQSLKWKGIYREGGIPTVTTKDGITTKEIGGFGWTSEALGKKSMSAEQQWFVKAEKEGKSKVPIYAAAIVGKGSRGAVKGMATILGMEALAIPAGIEYTSVGLLGQKLTRPVGGLIIGAMAGGSVLDIARASYKGSQEFKELGLKPSAGAFFMGAGRASEVAGFWTGITKGEISPVQVQKVVTNTQTGETSTWSLGLVKPYSSKPGFALATYTRGEGVSLGRFRPERSLSFLRGGELEVGSQLGKEVFEKSIRYIPQNLAPKIGSIYAGQEAVLSKVRRLTTPGKTVVDIEYTKAIKGFKDYPQLQKDVVSFIKGTTQPSGKFSLSGLGTVMKENVLWGAFSSPEAMGAERLFGSATYRAEGGISKYGKRVPHDIDEAFYGKAIPKIQKFVAAEKAAGVPGAKFLTTKEGTMSFKGDKFFEGFGQDTIQLDMNPMGYRGQYPKTMYYTTGETLPGQKLGESLTQKYATVLTIKGTGKGITIGPPSGQEKSWADIYKMLGRSAQLAKAKDVPLIKATQKEYGQLIKQIQPGIDLRSGTIGGGAPGKYAKPKSIWSSLLFRGSSMPTSRPSLSSKFSSTFIYPTSSSLKSSFSSSSLSIPSKSLSSLSKSLSLSSKSSKSSSSSSLSSSSLSSSSLSSSSLSSSSLSSSSLSSSSLSSKSSSSRSSKSSSSRSSSSVSSSSSFGIPFIPGRVQALLPVPKPKGDLFAVEVRRRGKFEEVGKAFSLGGALQLGTRRVGETLGASLRVKKVKTGEIVPLTPFGFFRAAKIEKGVLVQRKGQRLISYGEKAEIQRERARRRILW